MYTRSRTRSTIHLALLLTVVSAPALHAAPGVPFKLAQNTLIIIPVTADGEGPFYFVLDTGAENTIVDTALARKLALPTLNSGNLTTVTGSRTAAVSRLATLDVGGAQVDQLFVFEADLSTLHRVDGRIAGILGQDFLSHFNYLLDYHARSIRFEQGDDLRDAIDGYQVPVETGYNKQMILAAEVQFRGTARLRLLLDSGTNTLVLMGSVSAPLHCSPQQEGTQISSTGTAPAHFGQVDLTVASHKFLNLPVTLAPDVPPNANRTGLLPMALFETIYVNNHENFVVLNPRAKKQ